MYVTRVPIRARTLLPVALLLVAGCGTREVLVSGRVLLNGKPLPGGRVTFRPADPRLNSVNAEVSEAGEYEVELPVGEVAISVDNRALQPRPSSPSIPCDLPISAEARRKLAVSTNSPASRPAATSLPGTYVPIPARYHDVRTSGLTLTVTGGLTTHDVVLEP